MTRGLLFSLYKKARLLVFCTIVIQDVTQRNDTTVSFSGQEIASEPPAIISLKKKKTGDKTIQLYWLLLLQKQNLLLDMCIRLPLRFC